MKKTKADADKEIESLKQTISKQAELLRSRDREAEKMKKTHEDVVILLRKELERAVAELETVDAELKIIDVDGKGTRVEQLQRIHEHLAGFTAASAEVTKKVSSRGGYGPGYSNTIARLRQVPQQIENWKESCSRSGARMSLALLLANQPEANLWQITKGFPELDCHGNPVNGKEAWRAATKYACKVARTVDTDQFLKDIGDPERPEGEPSDEECDDTEETVSDEASPAEDPSADATSDAPAS